MRVTVPAKDTYVDFPDGTSQDVITKAIKDNWDKLQPKKAAPSRMETVGNAIADSAELEGKANRAIGETALSMGSGMASAAVGGLGGLLAATERDKTGKGAFAKGGADRATDIIQKTQKKLTYQPKSEEGQALTQAAGEVQEAVVEKPSKWVGQKTLDVTGSPALAAGAETVTNFGIQALIMGGPKGIFNLLHGKIANVRQAKTFFDTITKEAKETGKTVDEVAASKVGPEVVEQLKKEHGSTIQNVAEQGPDTSIEFIKQKPAFQRTAEDMLKLKEYEKTQAPSEPLIVKKGGVGRRPQEGEEGYQPIDPNELDTKRPGKEQPKSPTFESGQKAQTGSRIDKAPSELDKAEMTMRKGLDPNAAPFAETVSPIWKDERGSIQLFKRKKEKADLTNILPTDANSVRQVHDMYEGASDVLYGREKTTFDKVKSGIVRGTIDVSGIAKNDLKKMGTVGEKAIVDRDLVSGASGYAGTLIEEAHNNVYKGLNQRATDLLDRFIQSRRIVTIDSYKQNMKHPGGLTGVEHQKYLDNFGNVHNLSAEQVTDITARAGKYFDAMKGQLKDLLDNGIIDQATHDSLARFDYQPREFLQHIDPEQSVTMGGKKINITDSGVKALEEGSYGILETNSEKLLNQVVSRTQSRIFKNRANNSIYDVAMTNSMKDFLSVKPFKDSVELSMYRDGQKYTFHADKGFARDWVTSDPLISQTLGKWIGVFSGASILKAGATGYNPFFALGNMPRDLALIFTSAEGKVAGYSPHLPLYMGQLTRDLGTVAKDVFKRSGRVKEFAKEGGEMAFLTHYGKFRGQGVLIDKVKSLSDVLSWVGETSELWSRLALRERAIRNGATPKEATHLARNYIDFSQGGNITKALDAAIPYLNASIQGTRSIVRGAKTNPGRFTYQASQLAATATALYYANNFINPDCWKAVSDREKESNFIITTPFKYTDNRGQERHLYFKVAKDQGQRIFTSMADATLSAVHEGKFPTKQVTEAVGDFANVGMAQLLPPTVSAAVSYFLNKDMWTGENVWKREKVEPKEEYTDRTNPLFVAAGQATGLSPERLQTATNRVIPLNNPYTGLVMGGLKAVTGQLSKEMQGKTFTQMATENPSIRRVFASTNPYTQYQEDIEKTKLDESTRRWKQHRELDGLVDDYLKTNNGEAYDKIEKLVSNAPEADQKRLLNRMEKTKEYFNVPERSWWVSLSQLAPESRADVFYKRFKNASEQERGMLLEYVDKLKGITSDRMVERLKELAGDK